MIRIRRREDIICHIRPHILIVVPPRDARRHLVDGADLPPLGNLPARVRVALDVVGSALPSPGCGPRDAVVGGAVEVGALGARGGRVFAPEVVEELVAVAGPVGVELAEGGSLAGDEAGGLGHAGRGEEEGGDLHGCGWGGVWAGGDDDLACWTGVGAGRQAVGFITLTRAITTMVLNIPPRERRDVDFLGPRPRST